MGPKGQGLSEAYDLNEHPAGALCRSTGDFFWRLTLSLPGRGFVRHDDHVVVADAAGGDRFVAG